MKAKNSKRNRHTGHINAFKAMVIKRGKKINHNGKIYHRAFMGGFLNKDSLRIGGGYCIVRD